MLDLNFVRANLELVEEKLRARGLDPATLLGDFRELDLERRARITQAESLQAQRNKLSQEVARSRKAGADAAQVAGGDGSDPGAEAGDRRAGAKRAQAEEAMRALLIAIPNLTQDSVPLGKSEADNVEVLRWGQQPVFDFAPSRIGSWARAWAFSTLRTGSEDLGRALCRLLGPGRPAGAGAGQLHAGYPHPGARLPRGAAALPGKQRLVVWHRPAAQVRRGSLQVRGQRPLADPYRRGAGDESVSRRSARRSAIAREPGGLHPLLPFRGGFLRQGCARNHPPAPVSKGRAGQVCPPRAVERRA
jgi:hypothetical protein